MINSGKEGIEENQKKNSFPFNFLNEIFKDLRRFSNIMNVSQWEHFQRRKTTDNNL